MLREILNQHRWQAADLPGLQLTVRHRGAPGDVRVVSGLAIAEIVARGLELFPEDGQSEGAFIPFHRILRVDGPDGPIWVRGGPNPC